MKKKNLHIRLLKVTLSLGLALTSFVSISQTNVYDDVIATSSDHTTLKAAIDQQGLQGALQDGSATLTVFAPDNQAFEDLASALSTDLNGLLQLPNLTDILLYHVLGSSVNAADVNNGDIVNALSTTNTLKLTKTSMGDVYVNQSRVIGADLNADNGVVHSINKVVLPFETVVDIAIDNNFTSLTAAVVEAELLPALTDPLATLTVFAPDNNAFSSLATALGTDVQGLLALPNLQDILLYHVLGSSVNAADVNNGDIVNALSTTNTLKLTKTSAGDVYVNQAMVDTPDLTAANGVVHTINKVVLPFETVVDIAIDNNFTSLTAAVVEAELLPALTDPLQMYTVFAPTDAAFNQLATDLNTDLAGVLANPELADILLYHVVSGNVLSTDLSNGMVPTLNGQSITVDLTNGVMINSSNVTTADIPADNGVVHIIDKVLLPSLASIDETESINIKVYPNPSTDVLTISTFKEGDFTIVSLDGKIVAQGSVQNGIINVSSLTKGQYILNFTTVQGNYRTNFIKK